MDSVNLTPDWFWSRVDMSGGADACWLWLGSIQSELSPYGRFFVSRKSEYAHRFALLISKGPPPRNSPLACHTCDNPPCCNPNHLWWGSSKENTQDSCDKERFGAARRKIDRVEAIRLRKLGHSYSEIAATFGVNQASVSKALIPLGLGGSIRPNQHKRAIAGSLTDD